jgi:hypothetical protein
MIASQASFFESCLTSTVFPILRVPLMASSVTVADPPLGALKQTYEISIFEIGHEIIKTEFATIEMTIGLLKKNDKHPTANRLPCTLYFYRLF